MTAKNPILKLKAPVKEAPVNTRAKDFGKHLPWVLVAILFLALSLIYFPVAYKHMEPQASDITQWRGAAKAIMDYNAENKDNALWTPNMFSGMPSYMISFPNRYPFLESITRITNVVISWRIFLLFIGGLGIFLLIRFWKLSPWIAFFAAIAFMFSCHWVGLLDIGHNTKYRAIMYIPWVLWSLFRLQDKPNLLNLGLLATFLITQLRENHPQITYYLYLFIAMFWVYVLIESGRNKAWKSFITWTLLLGCAFGLTALAVMNPYLSTMEYSHFTMRGGAAGLEKSYAQAWSFPPAEIVALVIPDFFGGINQTYWGYMPFTQIYNYFGIVVLALGVLALFGKHRRMAVFLWISSFIFTLMSFGSFTPALSDMFLKLLPFFNKFRVPSMILTMVQVNAVLLAALGIDGIIEKAGDQKFQKALFKVFWICGGVFILFVILSNGMFKGLPFTTAAEYQNYSSNNALSQLAGLKSMRLDMLVKSGILSLLFLTVTIGLGYLFSTKKMKAPLFVLLLTMLCFIDLWIYTGKHLKDVYPVADNSARFEMRDFDQFLLQDKDNFRIYPFNMNRVRPAGEWAYYHQSVDGYSAAKLKRYDDILKLIQGDAGSDGEMIRYLRGMYGQEGRMVEKPMPVLNMLSAKYFVLPDSLPYVDMFSTLRQVYSSGDGVYLYQNLKTLPRAWFVDSLHVIPDEAQRLSAMKDEAFNPAHTAIVESSIAGTAMPDSSYARLLSSNLHSLSYDVYTNKDAYLVLSEVYYPAGWKAFLNGKELEIHPTNHVLRGLVIPAGKHTLELQMAPKSYPLSVRLSLAGLIITVLAVLGGWAMQLKNKEASEPTP